MMKTKDFVGHLQQKIIANDTLRVKFNTKNVVREKGVFPDDKEYPVITLLVDDNPTLLWAPFAQRVVTFKVHTKDFFDAEDTRDALVDQFHLYSYSSQKIDIHRMEHLGSMGTPSYNKATNSWFATVMFNVRSG